MVRSLLSLLFFLNHGWSSIDLQSIHEKESLLNKAYYASSTDKASVDSVVIWINSGSKFQKLSRFNLGYIKDVFWVVIPIADYNRREKDFLLDLQNPHTDKIQAFLYDGKRVEKFGPDTGDTFVFDHRLYNHRNFVWPLPHEDKNYWVILRVDKKNSSLNIPLYLWEANAFRKNDSQQTLFYGLCLGMQTLVALYSLGVWVFLRKKIYGWFFARIVTGILLLAAAEGLTFQYIYPSLAGFNNYFRLLINALQGIAAIGFAQLFLSTKSLAPKIHFAFDLLFYLQLAMCVSLPVMYDHYTTYSLFWIPFALSITLVLCVLRVGAALVTFPVQKQASLFYLVSYGPTLIFGVGLILEEFGVFEKFTFNPLFIGLLIEIIVLSIGLTFSVKKVYDERNDYSMRISRHQKEMMHAYVDGMEKERQRIAGELHDDIGSRLANLYRMVGLAGQGEESLKHQVELISNDVRSLSHQLAPVDHDAKSLRQMVIDLAADVQATTLTEISVQFYDLPQISADLALQTYRCVQEILSNMAKHSKAKHVDIQLYGYENEMVLTYEDDGVGFDNSRQSKGIGLKQLQTRLLAMHGSIEISSAVGNGVQMLIRVPLS